MGSRKADEQGDRRNWQEVAADKKKLMAMAAMHVG